MSWNPTRTLALQGSWARFMHPEQLEPTTNQTRWSASALWADDVALGWHAATTLAWGRNARKATITDPRVRKLADGIIKGQVKEIAEMKILISDIEANGSRGRQRLQPVTASVTNDMQPEIAKAVR